MRIGSSRLSHIKLMLRDLVPLVNQSLPEHMVEVMLTAGEHILCVPNTTSIQTLITSDSADLEAATRYEITSTIWDNLRRHLSEYGWKFYYRKKIPKSISQYNTKQSVCQIHVYSEPGIFCSSWVFFQSSMNDIIYSSLRWKANPEIVIIILRQKRKRTNCSVAKVVQKFLRIYMLVCVEGGNNTYHIESFESWINRLFNASRCFENMDMQHYFSASIIFPYFSISIYIIQANSSTTKYL